jgi:hypothetical protein
VQGQRAQSRSGAQGQWQAWQAWQTCRRGRRAVDAKNRGKLRAGRWVAVPKDAVGGQSAVCGAVRSSGAADQSGWSSLASGGDRAEQ